MSLKKFRDEGYARTNWSKLRPFYCRLSPEFLWDDVRKQIVEELNEEIQANASETWEYATYFTYPTDEQMESIHEGGLFFSEIREIVGYRSAEALSLLAGLIRLEPDGDVRVLLEESFANLWQKFGEYGYGHGYDTPSTRADLVLMLSSNNVFGLVHDRSWIERTRNYFMTDTHPWSQRPLRDVYPAVLRALDDTETETDAKQNDPILSGVFDLQDQELEKLKNALFWAQGPPEEFRSATPLSVFYRLPYHLVKFVGGEHLDESDVSSDPFGATVVHFFKVLRLRTTMTNEIGIGSSFDMSQATEACGGDAYAASMTLGQMIKIGLVDFDSNLPWFHQTQQFRLRKEARYIS